MDERIVLMADGKEKLVDEILDLRRRINDLQSVVDSLRQENDALKKKSPGNKPTDNNLIAVCKWVRPDRRFGGTG